MTRHEAVVERSEQRWIKANAALCLRIERLEKAVGHGANPEGGG